MLKFIMAFLILGSTLIGQSQSNIPSGKHMTQNGTKDQEDISKLLFLYRDALNASDVNKVMSLYAEDGVFMPSNAPSAVGTEQIKASYTYVFNTIQLSIEFYVDEIEVFGDIAYARTTSKGTTLIHANGQTVPEENRELFVLEKTSEGWKISRYMFNKMK